MRACCAIILALARCAGGTCRLAVLVNGVAEQLVFDGDADAERVAHRFVSANPAIIGEGCAAGDTACATASIARAAISRGTCDLDANPDQTIWLRREQWHEPIPGWKVLVPGCERQEAAATTPPRRWSTARWTAGVIAEMCPGPGDTPCAERAATSLAAARAVAAGAAREPWTVRRDALTFAATKRARIVRRDGANNRSLALELPSYMHEHATWSCARIVARNLCAHELQQRSCELERCADAVARAFLPPSEDLPFWPLRDEAAVRAAFGRRLGALECVTPRPSHVVARDARDAADGFPREFWLAARRSVGFASTRRGGAVTGLDTSVSCRTAGAPPVRVWFNTSDMRWSPTYFGSAANRPGGYFEVQGQTHTSLVRHMDTSECAARCVVVDDPREADLLVAERTPPAAKASGQLSVHMTAEAKWLAERAGDFDLSMDMSLEANVPLPHVPARFAERIAALPPPARESLERKKLAVWLSSNCCETTWDRIGYVAALAKHLGADLTLGGKCAEHVVELAALPLGEEGAAREPPQVDKSAFRPHWDDAAMTLGDDDVGGDNRNDSRTQLGLYSNYLFVLSFAQTLSNENLDEKFFEPFLANTVPVVVGGAAAPRLAPGGRGSYVDATRFNSPSELAAYLRWLARNPREYLRYFERRRDAAVLADLARLEGASAFRRGAVCRLCSCVCDPACLAKRRFTRCGYEPSPASVSLRALA